MGREISLFADFKQKENKVTNYCGLMLKLLYEDSPNRFQELLTSLVPDIDLTIGPVFTQQKKEEKSIPDLSIVQQSISVFFETKLTDWFYSDQVTRHIQSFSDTDAIKILFLLSNFDTDQTNANINQAIEEATKSNIVVQIVSYEDLVGALEKVVNSEFLKSMLEEFTSYLDRNNLLPKWKYLLDVVNCTGTMSEVESGAYMCPDTGGAYSHRRAKYFGPYKARKVETIYEIQAVISIDKGLSGASVKWANTAVKHEELIKKAMNIIKASPKRLKENQLKPLQVFLLENGEATQFLKGSSGGMQQSKRYFWDIATDVTNSKELAAKLNGELWETFRLASI